MNTGIRPAFSRRQIGTMMCAALLGASPVSAQAASAIPGWVAEWKALLSAYDAVQDTPGPANDAAYDAMREFEFGFLDLETPDQAQLVMVGLIAGHFVKTDHPLADSIARDFALSFHNAAMKEIAA